LFFTFFNRYIFRDGKRCDLQELGPRFTLKMKWLQKGTFSTKDGDYEWIFKVIVLCSYVACLKCVFTSVIFITNQPEMETSRKRFFL
jgi:hypothetical protein